MGWQSRFRFERLPAMDSVLAATPYSLARMSTSLSNSPTFWYRLAGSVARHFMTTSLTSLGIVGSSSTGAGALPWVRFNMLASTVSALKGTTPVSIS